MLNAKESFEHYGGFHDANIEHLSLDPKQKQLVIVIDDVNDNYDDLADYVDNGANPAVITLTYETIDFAVDSLDPFLSIYDCEAGGRDNGDITIRLSPSGLIKLSGCSFKLVIT